MKKIVCSMLIFMVLVYAIPVATVGIKTSADGTPQNDLPAINIRQPANNNEEPEHALTYDNKTEVSVLINGSSVNMTLHDYLTGVLAAEMPASFPMEALKAQAVAARSYALYKIQNEQGSAQHKGTQLCDDYTHCAAYFDIEKNGADTWGDKLESYSERVEAAVTETDGVVAVCDGEIIAAVFHSASSDRTEAAVNVWGYDYPYLKSVESYGGSDSPGYYGTVVVKCTDFVKKVQALYPHADFSVPASQWFKASQRSESGGIVSVMCGGVSVKGTELRSILGLNSTNFKVEVSGENLVFTTKGTGHGVGLSQYGARAMALDGAYFDEIIKHYYSGVELMLKK